MKTLFRTDIYHNNFGTFIGFFNSLDEASFGAIQISEEPLHGCFLQVTEFKCYDHLNTWDAWNKAIESEKIVKDYYFEKL